MQNLAAATPPAFRHPPGLPFDRAVRARAVLDLVPPAAHDGLTGVLDEVVERCWQRHVVRRARAISPALLHDAFAKKARAGFSTYCALGLSAIVCSRTRPTAIQLSCAAARALDLGPARVRFAARRLFPSMYGLLCAQELERVALMSFLILALDEILDDVLQPAPPQQRAEALGLIVRERRGPAHPLVTLACEMLEHLRVTSRDPARFDALMERVASWAEDEVALETGSAAEGHAHVDARKKTIEVSMELLGFACEKYVGDRELQWMQGIAALGQMVDDFVDVEKDLAAGRRTPAIVGAWDATTVAGLHAQLVDDTLALLAAAGERHPATLELYEQTFRAQLRHMAVVLVENP